MTFPRIYITLLLSLVLYLQSGSCVTTRASKPRHLPDLYEASVSDLQAGLDAGQFTSVDLVKVSQVTQNVLEQTYATS